MCKVAERKTMWGTLENTAAGYWEEKGILQSGRLNDTFVCKLQPILSKGCGITVP